MINTIGQEFGVEVGLEVKVVGIGVSVSIGCKMEDVIICAARHAGNDGTRKDTEKEKRSRSGGLNFTSSSQPVPQSDISSIKSRSHLFSSRAPAASSHTTKSRYETSPSPFHHLESQPEMEDMELHDPGRSLR